VVVTTKSHLDRSVVVDDTTIIVKSGSGKPEPSSLEVAELALDVTDGALYSKLQDGDIHQLNDGADDVDLSDYVTEAPIDTKQYARQDGSWSEIVIPDGGTGSSVHIGDTPPDSPQEGQQWMEVPASGDATMWIFDGDKWLQQPGSKDGADGADGADGLWTDNGDTKISYTAGCVGIGGVPRTSSRRLMITDTGDCRVDIRSGSDTNLGAVDFSDVSNTGRGQIIYDHSDDSLRLKTLSKERLAIDADGFVDMAGGQIRTGLFNGGKEPGISFRESGKNEKFRIWMSPSNYGMYVWDPDLGDNRMNLDNNGNMFIHGNIYKNGATPVMATSDMVKAFSKLRDAVKDEDTVEALKGSITNCIGGLIEEWESMQASTQEISNE
jgi:hypothetical protein